MRSSTLRPIRVGSSPTPRMAIAPIRVEILAHCHTVCTAALADPEPEANKHTLGLVLPIFIALGMHRHKSMTQNLIHFVFGIPHDLQHSACTAALADPH